MVLNRTLGKGRSSVIVLILLDFTRSDRINQRGFKVFESNDENKLDKEIIRSYFSVLHIWLKILRTTQIGQRTAHVKDLQWSQNAAMRMEGEISLSRTMICLQTSSAS